MDQPLTGLDHRNHSIDSLSMSKSNCQCNRNNCQKLPLFWYELSITVKAGCSGGAKGCLQPDNNRQPFLCNAPPESPAQVRQAVA